MLIISIKQQIFILVTLYSCTITIVLFHFIPWNLTHWAFNKFIFISLLQLWCSMQGQFYSAMRSCNQLHTCTSAGRTRTHAHAHTLTLTHFHMFPCTDGGWVMSASPYCYCDGSRIKRQQSAFISQTNSLSPLCRTIALTLLMSSSHTHPLSHTHTHTHTHAHVGECLGWCQTESLCCASACCCLHKSTTHKKIANWLMQIYGFC